MARYNSEAPAPPSTEAKPVENLQLSRFDIIAQAISGYEAPTNLTEAQKRINNIEGVPDFPTAKEAGNDLATALDAQLMAHTFIPNKAGLSATETTALIKQEGRKPYQSRLRLSTDLETQVTQLLNIAHAIRLEGEEDYSLVWAAATTLFIQDEFDLTDKLLGIDPAKRIAGTITTEESTYQLFDEAANSTVADDQEKTDLLYQEMLAVTEGGNLRLIHNYLENRTGTPELRQALLTIYVKMMQDEILSIEKIRLTGLSHAFFIAAGFDINSILRNCNYDSTKQVEEKLLRQLGSPTIINNLLEAVKQEAPAVLSQIENKQEVTVFDILGARAQHLQQDDAISTLQEYQEQLNATVACAREAMPLLSFELPSVHGQVFYSLRAGTDLRSWLMFYYNESMELVADLILNPRQETSIQFALYFHEYTAHWLQANFISLAEQNGVFELRSFENVSHQVAELFAGVIERQASLFWKNINDDTTQTENAPNTSTLYPMLVARKQALNGLNQVHFRQAVEDILHGSLRALTIEEARSLNNQFQEHNQSWQQIGISIDNPHQTLATSISASDPVDGLYYSPEVTGGQELNQALEKRFGEVWLDSEDASYMWAYLLMKAADEIIDEKEYVRIVQETKIDDIKKYLSRAGIQINQ